MHEEGRAEEALDLDVSVGWEVWMKRKMGQGREGENFISIHPI